MKTDQKMIIIPDFLIFLKQLSKESSQSVTNIQLETKITYSHLHNMKKILEDKGLITIKKVGVKNVLNLTSKGSKVVDKAVELFELLDITQDNISEYRRRGKIKNKDTKKEEEVKDDNFEQTVNPKDLQIEENGREDKTTQE